MSLQRNFYEVLGVPQAATTDQIKKKYRELARKFHPDVVKDKDLGQRVFSQINQAYRVLSDSDRRAQYNASLIAAANTAAANNGTAGSGTATAQTAQPNRPYTNGTANGAAQANRPYANGAASAPSAASAEQPVSAQKLEAIPKLLGLADNAIMAGKPVEAGEFCTKVLQIDPLNVRALDISGDALSQQGKREEAAAQYRKALQAAPSHSIQAKLTRLEQAPPSARPRPTEQASPSGSPKPGNGAAKPSAPSLPPRKPVAAATGADKAGGLFGRLLGRK